MSLSFPRLRCRVAINKAARPDATYGDRQAAILNAAGLALAKACITGWPGYEATPLVLLSGLAGKLGIAGIYYKQEADRFGLRSFKPLGGAFAVQRCLMRALAQQTGRSDVTPAEIVERRNADFVAQVTVTAATDGNHGRSVAWGARMFGCRCVIFINEAVTKAREQAIASFGAEVRRVSGTYDDAVRRAFETAQRMGWHLIPDTGHGGVFGAPRDVTQGYAVLADEVIEQLGDQSPPTHMFLQAGVGGMAAAVTAQFWQVFGINRPKTIVVEPEQSACWMASLANGCPTPITDDVDSFMSGLACGEISRLAWDILEPGAFAAVTIQDQVAPATMRLLADGVAGDPPLVGGESGVAGLAGLIACARNDDVRQVVELDPDSRVLIIGSEGATDETVYKDVVGRAWNEVAEARVS